LARHYGSQSVETRGDAGGNRSSSAGSTFNTAASLTMISRPKQCVRSYDLSSGRHSAHQERCFNPNFGHSPAKLLIFLYTAPFCSHNISLFFILTSTWVPEFCESTETKSTLKHPRPIVGNRSRGL
jgi:hypothetical protein